jgi:hypothetical protein
LKAHSDAVIVFISKSSITKSGYVQKEIKFALDIAGEKPGRDYPIIPARFEEYKLPDRLASLHCIDLWKPNSFDNLLRAIRYTPQESRRRAINTASAAMALT